MEDLFLSNELEFEKVATEVDLPDDPNTWPQEILQQLFKQVPFISDFEPHVVMDRVDAEKQYGFGHVEVTSKSEVPMGNRNGQQAAGVKSVRIPVIVNQGKLQPFDVLVTEDSRMLPLTESRLRQAVFRPQMFDVTSKTPGDQSMVSQLYPPQRQHSGMGGGSGMTYGAESMGKMGSDMSKEAIGLKTVGNYLKTQKDPARLANFSRLATSRGAQLATQGGEAADKGRKLLSAGTIAAQRATKVAGVELDEEKTAVSTFWLMDRLSSGLHPAAASGKRVSEFFGRSVKNNQAANKKMRSTMGDLVRVTKEQGHNPSAVQAADAAVKRQNKATAKRGLVSRMAGAEMDRRGLQKQSSVLEAVLPSARRSDLNKVASQLQDPAVQSSFLKNKFANKQAIQAIFFEHSMDYEKTASVEDFIRPTVVQLMNSPEGGYILKTANPEFWEPKEVNIDRGEAIRRFGEKTVLAADMSEGVVAAEGPQIESDGAEQDEFELIKDYGLYKVKTVEGQEIVGYVFPNLLDLDGKPLPLALFTNGSQSAVQGEIVGVRAGEGQSLPQGGRPRGHGCFYRVLPNGKAEATLPMTVQASLTGSGASFQAELFDGQSVEVIGFQPNLQTIQVSDGQMLVPESFHWLPLDASQEVSLMGTPEETGAAEAMKEAFAKVTVRYNDGLFSFSGMPIDKLASEQKDFLHLDEAVFLLAGMGVSQNYAEEKLGQATVWSQPVEVKIGRVLRTADEQRVSAVKMASSTLAKMPFHKVSLVKEAAAIPDPLAVDTVLSIGFLNPENAMVFLEALPAMEKAQERMCELLVATRLGMRDIPVSALENAVRNVEEVIEGLKVMAFQQS